jgi:hypothetical protein
VAGSAIVPPQVLPPSSIHGIQIIPSTQRDDLGFWM